MAPLLNIIIGSVGVFFNSCGAIAESPNSERWLQKVRRWGDRTMDSL